MLLKITPSPDSLQRNGLRPTGDLTSPEVSETIMALNNSGSSFLAPLPFGQTMLDRAVRISQVLTLFKSNLVSELSGQVFFGNNLG